MQTASSFSVLVAADGVLVIALVEFVAAIVAIWLFVETRFRGKKPNEVLFQHLCPLCNASGTVESKGKGQISCPTCCGDGIVHSTQPVLIPCRDCHGRGTVFDCKKKVICDCCQGIGLSRSSRDTIRKVAIGKQTYP